MQPGPPAAPGVDAGTPLATGPVGLGPPPAALRLAPFYRKYLDAEGVPIVASDKVPDAALHAAREVVTHMLAGRPDIVARLQAARIRVAIMAETELTIDIPEHADLYTAFPGTDWNARARGLGATLARPASSAAEENLLCYPSDRYRGESILVHEFAHTVYLIGVQPHDAGFAAELVAAFDAARAAGKWTGTYAASNVEEYWAEGAQDWFDANLEASPPNGIHNEINTRAELEAHDPALAGLLRRVFGDRSWRHDCPAR